MKTICLMMTLTLFVLTAYSQTNPSAKNTSDKLIDHIVGTWNMTSSNNAAGSSSAHVKKQTNAKNTNVTAQGAPTQLRLKRDMRYIASDDNKTVIDSGSFRINENHKRLYLQSDLDSKPTEWDVTLNKNQLILQADSVKNKDHVKYFYTLSEQ